MKLKNLMDERQMSIYRLSQISHIPYSTLSDLVNGKTSIMKCSLSTVSKIANALQVDVNVFVEPEDKFARWYDEQSFELFKSNVCHILKNQGDIAFIIDTLEQDRIRTLYQRHQFAKAFYMLAMLDYLCRVNDIPICADYNDLRNYKLQKPLYPSSVLVMAEVSKSDDVIKRCEDETIPESKRYNIYESKVRHIG